MLYTLDVSYFRAVGASQRINFAVPTGKIGSGLTVLVGQNNTGKSTFLRSVMLLAKAVDAPMTLDDANTWDGRIPSIIVSGKLEKQAWSGMLQKREGSTYVANSSAKSIQVSIAYIPSRRPWSDRINGRTIEATQFEFDYSQSNLEDGSIDQSLLSSSLRNIEAQAEKKSKFSDAVRSIEPTIRDWDVSNINGADTVRYQSVAGKWHKIGSTGDGITNLFRIVFSLLFSSPVVTVLLDEPELSLHPQAQRRLYNLISKVAINRQVVIATHSPHFVNWRDIFNGAKLYRVASNTTSGASLFSINDDTLSHIKKIVLDDKFNTRRFDVVAKELFFSNGILFLEGYEDVHLVEDYAASVDIKPLELFGYGCGGAGNMCSWLQAAVDLNIRCAAIFDDDSAGQTGFAEAQEKFGKNNLVRLAMLPAEDIRDKFSDNNKTELKKNGVFNRDWNIKPEMKPVFDKQLQDLAAFLWSP